MKALTRNKGETITESMNVVGIDWNTGMPLTNPEWAGGPYRLVLDYDPTQPDVPTEPAEISNIDAAADTDTVVIDGVEYRRV